MSDKDKTEDIIEITPAAVDKIAELIAGRERGPLAVRVVLQGALPGGGFQSEFKFVDQDDFDPQAEIVQDAGAFRMYYAHSAAESLAGAKVDFDEAKYVSGFHIEYPEQLTGRRPDKAPDDWQDPLARMVQVAINDMVNPGLAGHGGWVALLEVKQHTAYIEMGGGCQGCGLSETTLKQGIERIVTDYVPEIKQVLDITDHAEGKNPYYTGNWDNTASSALSE